LHDALRRLCGLHENAYTRSLGVSDLMAALYPNRSSGNGRRGPIIISSEPEQREAPTPHVMSSGAGRRAALACGVETSPEEYEWGVLLGGALSAVGTGTTTETGMVVGVRSRLHGARTTPGISPRARSARLVEMTREEGDEGAFEACHPERSRGVSSREWGNDWGPRAKPRGLRTRVGRLEAQ
jgi:hypothetical protein